MALSCVTWIHLFVVVWYLNDMRREVEICELIKEGFKLKTLADVRPATKSNDYYTSWAVELTRSIQNIPGRISIEDAMFGAQSDEEESQEHMEPNASTSDTNHQLVEPAHMESIQRKVPTFDA